MQYRRKQSLNKRGYSIIYIMVIRARENLLGAWAFLGGVLLALLVGIFAGKGVDPIIAGILAILGVVVGFFVSDKDVQTFLLASVSLVIVSYAGVSGLILNAAVLGLNLKGYVLNTLGALLTLFVPATIIVAIKTVFSLARS
jgi:hypothetical protein